MGGPLVEQALRNGVYHEVVVAVEVVQVACGLDMGLGVGDSLSEQRWRLPAVLPHLI